MARRMTKAQQMAADVRSYGLWSGLLWRDLERMDFAERECNAGLHSGHVFAWRYHHCQQSEKHRNTYIERLAEIGIHLEK